MADLYDPVDRLVGLFHLEEALRPHDAARALLVRDAFRRTCERMTPWWSPIRDVPSRSQMRDGWYWDGEYHHRYALPRARPPRPRVY